MPMAVGTAKERTMPPTRTFSLAGVQDEMAGGRDRAVAPGLKHGVEFGDSAADLGGGDFSPQRSFRILVVRATEFAKHEKHV
jgi:hypothetical protein